MIFDPFGFIVGLLGVVTLGLVKVALPIPEVSLSAQQFRLGRRRLAFADIDRALLDLDRLDAKRSLSLRFGSPRVEFSVHLRQGEKLRLDPRTRDTLLVAVENSAVTIPTDPYDPLGRFARTNAPQNLTKDEALAMLRHPPLPTEQLPITPEPSRLRPLTF
jgi:hypothetical protein